MKFSDLTAPEHGSKTIIINIIKQVLENRFDIKPNKEFILDVADYTIERTQVTRLIAENMIIRKASPDVREDYRLGKIIELLAIVNRAIDIVSYRNNSVSIFPR